MWGSFGLLDVLVCNSSRPKSKELWELQSKRSGGPGFSHLCFGAPPQFSWLAAAVFVGSSVSKWEIAPSQNMMHDGPQHSWQFRLWQEEVIGRAITIFLHGFQEETMQLKFQQALVKHNTEPWWQKYKRCLVYVSHLALEAGYIALLFYALVWEVGDIVRLPTKIIGFFNFCLWDKEAGKLDCLALSDLEKMGVFTVGLMLSRVLVYVTPVLCLFVATTTLQAQCLKDRDIWKFARYLLVIGSIILPIGVALFLYHTRKWIQISEYGTVFVTLLGAMVLMLLHLIIIVLYLARFKDPLPKGEVCPAKSLP